MDLCKKLVGLPQGFRCLRRELAAESGMKDCSTTRNGPSNTDGADYMQHLRQPVQLLFNDVHFVYELK